VSLLEIWVSHKRSCRTFRSRLGLEFVSAREVVSRLKWNALHRYWFHRILSRDKHTKAGQNTVV
jgi:hypothetical protein